jgi:hypothetical protein
VARDAIDLRPEDDATAPLVELLLAHGADTVAHGGGRALLDHLLGTHAIVRRWGMPEWLQRAALVHSVYGTDVYGHRLLPLSARAELAAAVGDTAERLAYLFCSTPRGPLLAGTRRWAPDLPLRDVEDADPTDPPTLEELDALVLLHMANLADQGRSADGSPGRWLARLGTLAGLIPDTSPLAAPSFAVALAHVSDADETLVGRAYRAGVGRADDAAARVSRFALAATTCPVVAEPCLWLAAIAAAEGDGAVAQSWTAEARRRLAAFGTAWDKRLSYEEWAALADAIAAGAPTQPAAVAVRHPVALFDAVMSGRDAVASVRRLAPAAGRRRFAQYIEALAGDARAPYPGLRAQPWHDPSAVPLAGYLESHFPVIRDELLGLDASRFQPESERIDRRGDWDVVFLYERGRRHDDVCGACPVTVRGIDTFPAMRTAAGLIYVSRMRGDTHIAAHRGPTNLRLRCHLGLQVPAGDCAIRVGTETRQWETGRCLVFDDFFEHEAWNHTEEDRLVLIVDLWHPDLSPTEITLLEGLHSYTSASARRLSRYWATNDKAAAD